ncbi:Kef-type K+ transport system membrane protein [Streptomyces sp. NBRC 110611]|nr:Kef-type K+ transport system membrane protein [Streptomyces sp. NBRC 110611]
MAAVGVSGISFTAAFFPAEVVPTGLVSCAVARDAPDFRVIDFRLPVTPEGDLLLLSELPAPPDACSPTAESRPVLTRPAPSPLLSPAYWTLGQTKATH